MLATFQHVPPGEVGGFENFTNQQSDECHTGLVQQHFYYEHQGGRKKIGTTHRIFIGGLCRQPGTENEGALDWLSIKRHFSRFK
jgi:hypothetical protein